jgi:hypothetical protein
VEHSPSIHLAGKQIDDELEGMCVANITVLSDAERPYCSLKRAIPCYKQVKPQLQVGCMGNLLMQ